MKDETTKLMETMSQVEEWRDSVIKMITTIFRQEKETQPAAFLLSNKNGKRQTILVSLVGLFVDTEGKEMASQELKKLCQEHNAASIVFASEAWMTQMDKKTKQTTGRKEVLIITWETALVCKNYTYDIIRQGDTVKLSLANSSGFPAKGRFAELLCKLPKEN